MKKFNTEGASPNLANIIVTFRGKGIWAVMLKIIIIMSFYTFLPYRRRIDVMSLHNGVKLREGEGV